MNKTFPYAYINKRITPIKNANISIMSKAVQYGLGLFSGIRGHWEPKEKTIYLFRAKDHFERLKEGAKITGMKFNYTWPKFEKLLKDLVKKNGAKEDIYIRSTLYAAATTLTPRFDNPNDDLAIYMISLKEYFSSSKGLDVCISSWRRVDDSAISTKAKITGAYANSALAKTEAIANGFHEAIFLNQDGSVCEASGANIFGAKNGVLYTPPLGDNNLNGITRRSILELAKYELGLPVREESIDRSMLYTFDELFLTGTAAQVTWIKSVDGRQIGTGKEGATVKKLRALFTKITSADLPQYHKWLTRLT